jgi:Cu(I)/Ag(I) efflux system membrane protein CusA/SilA
MSLPAGYSIIWSGQYQYMQAAKKRFMVIIPLTVLVIFLILYLNTKSMIKTCMY